MRSVLTASGRVATVTRAAGAALALAGGLFSTSAAHATIVLLDVGKMDHARTVTIAGLGNASAAPMQFAANYGGRKVDLVAWCVDVYHHITVKDYVPDLKYEDTKTLTNDFSASLNPLEHGDTLKVGLLATYGYDVFNDAPVAPAAFTEVKPVAPVAPIAPVAPKAPTAPAIPKAPTALGAHPTPAQVAAFNTAKAAYDIKKAAYDVAKAQYDVQKAAYDLAKAQYDVQKATYDTAKAQYDANRIAYTAALAQYNADKLAHDQAVAAYNTAAANRYTTLSAVQSAIWQVMSNRDVTSVNHDAAFDLLVDNLSGDHLQDYFGAHEHGGHKVTLITPVQQFDSRGRPITATQSFVLAQVPEPAEWMLLIMGFGAAGAMVRRSRRRGAVVPGAASA